MSWCLELFGIEDKIEEELPLKIIMGINVTYIKPKLKNITCKCCGKMNPHEIYYKYLSIPISQNNLTIITKCNMCGKCESVTYKEQLCSV